MSKRSTLWKNKKATLSEREAALKEELEEISVEVESRVKKVLTISLIAGATVLLGYGLYRAFSSDEKVEKKKGAVVIKSAVKNQEPPSAMAGFSLKNALMERLALAAIQLVGTKLATYLAAKAGDGDSAHEEKKKERVKR